MKRHIHCHFTNVPSNIWSLVSLATIYNLFYGLPWTVNYTKLYNAPPKVFCITRYLQICLSSVQSLSHVRLFATPRITARQASLSITNSQILLKLMSIESVMPSNHLILCRPLLFLPSSFPASGSFTMSQFFTSGAQSIGVSASTLVLPVNTQDWSPLGWTGWISLQSRGLSRVFFNTTVQKHWFFGAQLSSQSNSHIHTWKNHTLYWMDICWQSNVSAF